MLRGPGPLPALSPAEIKQHRPSTPQRSREGRADWDRPGPAPRGAQGMLGRNSFFRKGSRTPAGAGGQDAGPRGWAPGTKCSLDVPLWASSPQVLSGEEGVLSTGTLAGNELLMRNQTSTHCC
ncbi:unnamed protein product [Gadus morhua 'NCC']